MGRSAVFMKTHGLTRRGKRHPLYGRYMQMRGRCQNPNNTRYKYYGARGIKICSRWQKFENFFKDMAPTFRKNLTLERKNNSGPYSPSNCVWTDWITQQNNKRNNHYLTLNGIKKSVHGWARVLGIPYMRIHERLRRGWPIKMVLSTKSFRGRRLNLCV